ncbi:amidase signature domain-containing protein [Biscogniauxia sp. FL1348]|nr:amidase signature domain-containing protein [Biscogniauxia sp. FL1348]
MSSAQRFSGYPAAREGPEIVYTQSEDKNPVLRGWALVIAANIITRSSMVANATWTNAKFGVIKDIPELKEYDWRLSHTVTPIAVDGEVLAKPEITPELYERQPSDIRGRFYSAADYHELYKSGTLTPLQVAKALLPLINPDPASKGKYASAWSVTREETVLAAAKASTERYASGEHLGVLDGVPVGVKDDIDVEGYISHFGLPIDPSDSSVKPATRTIWPIVQLEAAGAIVVGKAAMHELGLDTSGCNPRRGSPKNWNNTSYYTGGSSSGPGSALCAGLVPIAVGTDAGGSIRIPASFCGVFGLKPTLHRVFTMKSAICVIGPMAATAADLAIAYRIMSAPNPEDTIQGAFAPSIPPSPTAKKTIGICREWIDRSNPLVLDATTKAIAYFSDKLGYEVVDIKIPYLREGQWAHSAWALSEGLDHLRSGVSTPSKYLSKINHASQVLVTIGACTSALDMIKYGQLRGLLMEHLAFLFKKHPGLLIVTPTSPEPGWKVHPGDEAYGFSDGNFTIRNMMYIWLANSTGCPAVSAPIGFVDPEQGEGKLPIGLMAMGEWGAEEQLLAWAKEAEGYVNDCLEEGRVRPKEWADVVKLAQAVNADAD